MPGTGKRRTLKDMHKTPVIAHRGASGYEPENTLIAFRAAVALKADAIECDVQLCGSGELVVFHDRKLKRITGARGKIKRKKLAELRSLDAGKGEHIPTLKEVLDELDGHICINVELKSRRTAVAAAQDIRNSIRTGHWKTDDFFISSFYFRELRRFHEIFPEIPVALLFKRKPRRLKKRIKILTPFAASLDAECVKPAWVRHVHDHGLKVYIWTVDDPERAAELRTMGVDGFFSNYPDRLIKKR
jgi:glycerophosphoryl diester phosphodiesterase